MDKKNYNHRNAFNTAVTFDFASGYRIELCGGFFNVITNFNLSQWL